MSAFQVQSAFLPGDLVHVRVAGPIDATAYDAFRGEFERLLDGNRCRFVVDLTGVEYIGSAAVTVLTSALGTAQQRGGNVVIAGISEPVKQVFDILSLGSVFLVTDSLESARACFA